MHCPICGEECSFLGRLGRLLHFRCRNCGMLTSTDIDHANEGE